MSKRDTPVRLSRDQLGHTAEYISLPRFQNFLDRFLLYSLGAINERNDLVKWLVKS